MHIARRRFALTLALLSGLVIGISLWNTAPNRAGKNGTASHSLAAGKSPTTTIQRKLSGMERKAASAEWFMEQRTYGLGYIPKDAEIRALDDMRTRMIPELAAKGLGPKGMSLAKSSATQLNWQFEGPGNIGGRLRGLVVHPNNPNIIYAGSVSGGVWKTTNGGASWFPTMNDLITLNISALEMKPGDPNTLYAGTGEGWFYSSLFPGRGVLKTTDGGQTWTRLHTSNGLNSPFIMALAVTPAAPNVIYAAGRRATNFYRPAETIPDPGVSAIFKSSDAGQTWQDVTSGKGIVHDTLNIYDEWYRAPAEFVNVPTDVVVSPLDANIVYASFGFLGSGGVWKSSNGGQTWSRLTNGLPNPALQNQGYDRIKLAISPSNPNILYASFTYAPKPGDTIDLPRDAMLGLWKTTDAGQTWRQVSTPLSTARLNIERKKTTALGNQGRYAHAMIVHPTDPNIVFIGGLDIYKTTDGGNTWSQVSFWIPPPWSGESLPFVHADHHVFAFDRSTNPATLYNGSDGGVARSRDLGKTWQILNRDLGVTQFYYFAAHPTAPRIMYGGTQDNGTLALDNGNSNAWFDLLGGDGGPGYFDYQTPTTLYASIYYTQMFRAHVSYSPYFRVLELEAIGYTDGSNGITKLESDSVAFFAPYELSPNNPNVLVLGTYRVLKSINQGDYWTPISGRLSPKYIVDVAIAEGNDNIIWAASREARIYKTENNGASWTDVTAPHLPKRFVGDIEFDPSNPRTVYLTYSGYGTPHVFKSTDAGATWANITNNLPDTPVNIIQVHPQQPNLLFLGTDIGVFFSENGGQTWQPNMNGLPTTQVVDIVINPTSNRIYAATHGRGAYSAELGSGGGLNPPRNLVASASGNSVALQWNAPAANGITTATQSVADLPQVFNFVGSINTASTLSEKVQSAHLNILATNVPEVEPNNSPNQAQVLQGASPLVVDGQAEVTDLGVFNISFPDGSKDDIEDFFKITTTAPGLRVDLQGTTSDCDLYVLDFPPTRLLTTSIIRGGASAELFEDAGLAAGTYLIGVAIFDPAPAGGSTSPYTLTVTGQFSGGTAAVQTYNIYRSTSSPVQATPQNKIGSVNGSTTAFNDPNLASGTYFYVITAAYAQGESGPSNQASAQIGGGSLNAPRNLVASVSGNSAALRWETPASGGAQLAAEMAASDQKQMLKGPVRRVVSASSQREMQTAEALSPNAVVPEVEPNNSRAQAQVLTGASPLGVDGKAEVADIGSLILDIVGVGEDDMEDLFAVTTTATGLKINLDGFTSDCDIYLVNPADLKILTSSAKVGATTPEEFNKTDLPVGTYLIAVTIFDPDPAGAPTTPYRLTVTGQFGGGTTAVQAYNIYRSISSPVQITPQNKIGSVNGSTTTFNDPNLASGTYFYVVTAAYAQGESGPSNQASAQVGGGCSLTWKADLTVKDAGGASEKLSLGQGPLSTNDIDNACGEAELPPPPPTGVFDARFEMPVSPAKSSRQDYRNDSEQTATWRVKFQPGVSGPITFSWNLAEFSNGSFFLKDEITGTLINVNMKSQNSFSLTQAGITSLKIEYSREAARDVSVNSGWNIISVPLAAANMAVSSLFPDAASPAFEFNNGYAAATTLANGKGYWIKFNGAKNYRVSGNSVPTREIQVKAGWNIIGAFENDASTAAITSVPAGIVASPYFGFNNGYSAATTLSPGKGYWVKVSQAGVLRLPSGIASGIVAKASSGDHEVDSAWPKLIIEDNAGNVATLYLAPVNSTRFELPPVPPAGIFDVRFSSGQYVESLDGSREIHLSAVQYPIRLKAQNLGERVINVKDLVGGNVLNATLTEGKPLVVAKALDKIMVTANQLPAQFALSQNYPNPFNPQTAIKFSLPKKAHVKISVFNLLGEKVAELANQEMEAGYHQIHFDARGHASGIYFYVMQAGDFRDMKKMIIAK